MLKKNNMDKSANAVSFIGGADGPTSIFLLKGNAKLTLKQKIERWIHKRKRAYVEKTLKSESHTIDEVIDYIVNVHGFIELDRSSDEVKEEYNQMRASFIMQYAPELLGEYAEIPELKGESKEDLKAHLEYMQERMQKAFEVSVQEFDIDYHKFQKNMNDGNDTMDIIVEKRFAHIGGGAVGNKRVVKKFNRIYKDVYKYYGVTEEDISKKSKRYEDVVRTLSR